MMDNISLFVSASVVGISFVVVVDMIDRELIPVASGFHTSAVGTAHLVSHPTSGNCT